jgi:hypothetical protein
MRCGYTLLNLNVLRQYSIKSGYCVFFSLLLFFSLSRKYFILKKISLRPINLRIIESLYDC